MNHIHREGLPMRIILNAPGIHPHTKEAVEKELEELTPRLKRILFQFRPEEKTLRVHLAEQKNNAYRMTISLRMPGKSIIVERTGHNLIPLVTEVKQSLFEQVKVQTSVMRKEHLRTKALQQSEAIREAVGAPSLLAGADHDEEELKDRFSARLRLVLQDLHSHVSRLIRSSQLAGDLQPNYLKPGEVVNDVVLRAYEVFRSNPDDEISPAKLYQLAENIILDEINNFKDYQESTVSMEEAPSTDHPWDVNNMGEGADQFYQPEEPLLYEDVMPDVHIPDPVRALNDEEQMEGIFAGLSEENPFARSAFLLNRVEGFEAYEIAWIQERDEKAVLKDIEECQNRLKRASLTKD